MRESIVQALIKLVERERITPEDIKDEAYKAEVQDRLGV